MEYVLLTGGLGFIGSHICVELLEKDFNIIVVDNLSNSSLKIIEKIYKITGREIIFYQMNVEDRKINEIFQNHKINSVIHLAGLKSVSESIQNPVKYYEINLNSTLNLIKCMENNNCFNLIFSSSATVYGEQKYPVCENDIIGKNISNPYGESKYINEKILMSLCKTNPKWKIISLRYFNPVGAHESGLLGESPNEIPNNLMPYILKVAYKNNIDTSFDDIYSELKIFGDDYPTEDGTCLRDFIHVVDLSKGHLAAIKYLDKCENYEGFNIGTGRGTSVLELLNTFIKVNKIKVPYKFIKRREGDIPIVYCDNTKALEKLNWKPLKTIIDICEDAWKFQIKYLTS